MIRQSVIEPIRVLHVMGKMNGGGVESMVMTYYRHIDKSMIQFDFIVDNDSRHVPYKEIENYGGRVYSISPYQNINQYKRDLKKVFASYPYTIIHSHINALSVFPLNAAKKAGIPVRIAHSHSTAAAGETAKNAVKNVLRPFSTLYPTHYCSCSRGAGEWLFGKKISEGKKLTIINNGIEIDRFQFKQAERKKLRQELQLTGKYVIGHTGRLCFQKNQTFLIELMDKLSEREKDTVLLLVGDGPDRQKLMKQAVKAGIENKVIFLGNKTEVSQYYQAMDIFLFPSRYEGFGISAIEAQISGLPALLSKNVPAEVGLTQRCNFLSIEDNLDEWIDFIHLYKEDPIRQFQVKSDDYDILTNVKQLEEYYHSLTEERAVAR